MRSCALLLLCPLLTLAACSSDDTGTGGSTANGGAGGATTSGGSGGTGAAPMAGLITGKVTRYDYVFDGDLLTADTKLTIDVAAPGGDCIDLESVPAPSGPVTWNDTAAISATVADGAYHACGAALGEGSLELQTPTVFAKKKLYGLDVGFSRKKDMDGGDFTYLVSWVGGCDLFGPCDDDPGTLAEMHFDIKHAAGTTVVCPGVLTPGDTSTHCDIAGTLAPTYSGVGWGSDPLWKRTPFMTANGVDWVFYEVPSGKLAASLDPATMKEFFGWMIDLLGPFPYGNELRFAGGPTAWLGFEHPANIVLLEDLDLYNSSYTDSLTHVTMHEITHQWAGDRTTIATAPDFVWKEATAEYLPYVFEDEHIGPDVAAATREYWDTISLQSEHFPRPTDDPMPHVSTFYGDVYGPGPMVLYVQLEALIGRPAVLAGIQAFLEDPGARSVDELRKAMETASGGKDLKPYFDAWVFGAGAPEWPTLAIETTQVGNEVTVKVTQENPSGTLYPCVVEVDVSDGAQSVTATIDFGLAPASPSATAKVTLAGAPTTTTLDPRNKLVARDKAFPLAAPKPHPVFLF